MSPSAKSKADGLVDMSAGQIKELAETQPVGRWVVGLPVAGLDVLAKAWDNLVKRRFSTMELTDQQRQDVKEWLASGASLSDVQKNLKDEFGIALTYMDVRLMVLEIGAAVKDKAEPKPVEPKPSPPPEDDPYADDALDDGAAGDAFPPGGGADNAKVSVSLDRVVRPGAMFSGDVTFSDGNKGKWVIDQYGRFGLNPDTPGYQPSPVDVQAFQGKLRDELRRHGYG